jgi:hypothetical protein
MNETTASLDTASKKLRSKLANGSKLLPLTDGRSATARRFRDLIEDISGDLGGADLLSAGQRQMVRRVALLSAESERLEALWSRELEGEPVDQPFDVDRYTVLTNALGRAFDRIGLARVPRDVSLSAYLDAKPVKPAEPVPFE